MAIHTVSQARQTFWAETTEAFLVGLLRLSKYPDEQITAYKKFYSSYVTPQLGPSPAEFKVHRPSSYMGDDCTPIEFSWAVGADGIQTIRFTMEPLSPDDGTPTPGSTWLSSLESLHPYAPSTNFDLTWSKICYQTLVQATCGASSEDGGSQHNSQFSIGADFTRSGHITGKSYFLPHMRSKAEGVSCSALVTGCMLQLGLERPWSAVHEYLKTLPASLEAIPEIVSVDCLEPCKNRVKVYLRTNAASLQSISEIMTLGLTLTDPAVTETVSTLRRLWHLLFPDAGDETIIPSRNSEHYASGFAIYFEMALGSPLPLPKVYIPVRHYCSDDLSIATAISSYFADFPKELSAVESIKNLFTHRALAKRTGIYTYVGCAARKVGPQVSLYLSPEAFAAERDGSM